MYHPASGYQQYYTQVSHDENTQQPYPDAPYPRPIYLDPSDPRHPQNLSQEASYYYYPPFIQPPPPEQYAPHVQPTQMAPGVSLDHASIHPLPPQALDPAFSADPRANLNNPYTHYTAYRMDSREEIVPAGISHDSFYNVLQQHDTSYQSRDPRIIPASSHKHRRDISSIYGPPLANPPNSSRPLSDGSYYSQSPYAAPSVHDSRASAASFGSVRLPYDVPETRATAIPIPPPMNNPSSSSSKLHKRHHSEAHQGKHEHSSASVYAASPASLSFSSSSSSFVHVHTPGRKSSTSLPSEAKLQSRSSLYIANPSPDGEPNAALKSTPGSPHSSFSSRSSASSPEEPITPPQISSEKLHASAKSSKQSKRSRSPKRKSDPHQLNTDKVNDIVNVAPTEDIPPAYTPLPAQTETITASSPIVESKQDVSVILSPEGITLSSSMGQAAVPGPSRERERNPQGMSESDVIGMPEPHVSTPHHSPPRDTAPDLAFPSSSQTSAATAQGPQPSVQAPSEVRKSRSRKPSIATPPKDLDKIDELDETDPLGFAWHHDSPYEAILRAVKGPGQHDSNVSQETGGPKIFQAGNGKVGHDHSKKSHRKAPPPMDPSITSFKVKPGEIFPPILPPQQIPLPPGVIPTPMSPQAPMSPLQKPGFTNAHLRPVGKYEPVPPPFSPTPSQMERATNPAHRMSIMSQMTTAEPRMHFNAPQQPMPPSLASAHSHSHSQNASQRSHHSSSSSSVPSSSHTSSSRSVHRGSPPQFPSNYDESSRRPRPRPQPVQPSQVPPRPQSTLSRSNTTPNPRTVPLPTAPIQYQKPASAPYLLSTDPPPAPDIRLPPPSVRTQSIAPPSVHSQSSSRQPQPHYLPKRLVMPTPLQPLQPLPHQHHQQTPPGVPMSSASSSYPHLGRGEYANSRTATGLKRGVTVGAIPVAQDIPMSAGRNLLKKHKDTKAKDKELERDIKELERRERERENEVERERERERERAREQGKEGRERERERQRGSGRSASVPVPSGATAVFTSKVVVPVQPSKSSGGGWGFGLFGSGDKSKAKEKEREKEREREREREERKKLSKRR
ncbi:hypothetical protein BDY19DRAFT_916380 [Irpex rosettiformis]|uniref:Uncharacterized protein n=1 Tax=Irpex rosettiformis TaxID=378272 RepID=A0ACB8ULH7_9APHY|nr:hypothetical protein BDY19DRAFT_916380 [Irpex rosettiformis]